MWLLVNHTKPTNTLYWNQYFLAASIYKSASEKLQNSEQLQNNTLNGAKSITINRAIIAFIGVIITTDAFSHDNDSLSECCVLIFDMALQTANQGNLFERSNSWKKRFISFTSFYFWHIGEYWNAQSENTLYKSSLVIANKLGVSAMLI